MVSEVAKRAGLYTQNLSLRLDDKEILQPISLNAEPGQVLGLLGPNGAGKTSLLKLLCGQHQSQDSVYLNEVDIHTFSISERARRFAVVNQMHNDIFALTLQEIIEMGLLPHKPLISRITQEDEVQINRALETVGLLEKRKQLFNSLSGGEQQRGLIARALVQQAEVLILDEPVNHLDIYYQFQIMELLVELSRHRNIAVIMSLHDLNLAAHYCDSVCLLNQGKLVSQGAPNQVLTESVVEEVFNLPSSVRTDEFGQLRIDLFSRRNPTQLQLVKKGAAQA